MDVVRRAERPRVLDVGCGSGRVAELILEAGASSYVGVDFSEPMLDLARKRLARFEDKTELLHGDFMTAPLEGPFDIVVGLGLFDYIEDPTLFVRRFADLAPHGSVVASFPVWSWLKGPLRKVRYEVLNSCPIFNYTPREVRFLFRAAGFENVEMDVRHAGIFVNARRAPRGHGNGSGRSPARAD